MPTPKESPKENRKHRAPEESAPRSDSVYPAGQDVKAQQERLRKAAVAATTVLKPSAPAASPQPAAPIAGSTRTEVAAPKPAPAQVPVAVQKAPAAVKAPTTSAAAPAAATTAVKAPTAPSPKPSPPAPARAPEKAAPATPKTRNFTFVFRGPDAKRVSVSGEFNGWSPDATPMKRGADGQWETTLALKPGRYQYKFVVDGNWTHDPNARENVRNEHGSLNSVTEIRP
jgi:hypothetical protein